MDEGIGEMAETVACAMRFRPQDHRGPWTSCDAGDSAWVFVRRRPRGPRWVSRR